MLKKSFIIDVCHGPEYLSLLLKGLLESKTLHIKNLLLFYNHSSIMLQNCINEPKSPDWEFLKLFLVEEATSSGISQWEFNMVTWW